ncbi:unnamed protein product [Phaedon cochleariae]|uniref:Uncharacterized protein n=1 Tax=Phaedon cochleariae TaxID=80249 RepID=A0A9N9SIN9_PHACE|nr:unnamed protein product [Phaedon cochleariae]
MPNRNPKYEKIRQKLKKLEEMIDGTSSSESDNEYRSHYKKRSRHRYRSPEIDSSDSEEGHIFDQEQDQDALEDRSASTVDNRERDISSLLRENPAETNSTGTPLDPEIFSRWSNYLSVGLDKETRDRLMQKVAKTDESKINRLLFGDNFGERCKAAQSVQKSSFDLKKKPYRHQPNAKMKTYSRVSTSKKRFEREQMKSEAKMQGASRRVIRTSKCVKCYEIPFCNRPIQYRPQKAAVRSETEQRNLQTCIIKMLSSGAIVRYNHKKGEFLSSYFLVPKPNGNFRGKDNQARYHIEKMMNHSEIKIREFSEFIGFIVSIHPAFKYGCAHTKVFEKVESKYQLRNNHNYNVKMKVEAGMKSELEWWLSNAQKPSNSIRGASFDLTIYTYASRSGWGAACGSSRAHGFWNDSEKKLHINSLELLATFNALKCSARNIRPGGNVLRRVDNTTAIAYINTMGGTRYFALNQIAKDIFWKWCASKDIFIYASYIKSEENIDADRKSRSMKVDTEYSLDICKVL